MSKVSHTDNDKSDTVAFRAEHSFSRESSENSSVFPALRRVGKLMSISIRNMIEKMSGATPEVQMVEPEINQYMRWCEQYDHLVSINMFSLSPMRGRIMLMMPPDMISVLVDAFFGGNIREEHRVKKEFTQTDVRFINRIAQQMARHIAHSWMDYGAFECQWQSHHHDIQEPRFAPLSAEIIVQKFRVKFSKKNQFELQIIYTMDGLQSIEALLEESEETAAIAPKWKQEMALALAEVYLPVRSVLARPTMSLKDLSCLKAGDIIPIPPARNLALLVGDRVFARGNIGEQNGLAAFRIDQLEQ